MEEKEQKGNSPRNRRLFYNPEKGEFEIAPDGVEVSSVEEQIKEMVLF